MPTLPTDPVRYPDRNTGRQGLDAPPPPDPDRTLLDILNRARGRTTAEVADMIRDAGYRRPTDAPSWAALMDYPPATVLLDGTGRVWTAEAVAEEFFTRYGPWTIIHIPPVPDVTNTP